MKRSLAIILATIFVLMSFTACSVEDIIGGLFGPKLRINVPEETLQAELGSFDLPKFDVVDEDNLIKAGYKVIVKKAVDPNGNEVTVAYNKINAIVPGVYTITYGVEEGKVKDADLKVDFADRTAPTLDMKEDALPKYYIQSMSYTLPAYSLSGEPKLDACYVKVYYMVTLGGEKTEVEVVDGRFTVEYNTGVYQILIHAEDAAGNAKEYTFNVEATGPSEVVEGKIIYSDEAFGASQLSFLWNVWSMEYTTEKAWGEEAGSIKVEAAGGATDYLILSKLIQRDVSAYDELVVRIYNANDYEVFTGCAWFGDTILEPNAWTEVVLSLEDLNAKGSHPAVQGLKPTSQNLENLALRFWTDFEKNTLEPGSVLYVSAMYAREQAITGPSEVKDDVIVYYDEIWGSMQGSFFWSDCNKQEFVTDIKYGEEAGSLKITCLKDNQSWNYYILKTPSIKDVSKYDFIEFYVYNPTEKDFLIQLLWGGDTTCKAGEWTRVKFPVSLITNGVTDVNNKPIPATDITDLTMCIWTTDMLKGDCFYFSQMRGGYEPEVLPDNLITNFDGATGLNPFNGTSSVEFVTDVKYGEEKGALKITANGGGEHYVSILSPRIVDVSNYDYIVFRVYTDKEITAGLLWCADTVCKAGEWTEIRVPVSYFAEGKVTDFAAALPATNISGISLRIFSGLEAGESVYVSAMYAMKDENVDPDPTPDPEPEPSRSDVIIGVDDLGASIVWGDKHTVTLDSGKVHGGDTASMKVEMKGSNGWNYFRLASPAITDVSSYDAIEFYVYNDTSADFIIGLLWCGDTTCKVGEWTKVSFPVSHLANVTDMAGVKIEATNIKGLDMVFYSSGTVVGESFYVSSIKAVGGEAPTVTPDPEPEPEIVEDLVSKLDGSLNPFQNSSTVEYVTDVKFGNEEGSLKITANATGEHYVSILAPELTDVSGYEYIVFRVYTDKEITAGSLWCADTVCKAGEWTEIKIPVSLFAEGKVTDFGSALPATNITGICVRIFSGLEVGESVYVSHWYAVK